MSYLNIFLDVSFYEIKPEGVKLLKVVNKVI